MQYEYYNYKNFIIFFTKYFYFKNFLFYFRFIKQILNLLIKYLMNIKYQ